MLGSLAQSLLPRPQVPLPRQMKKRGRRGWGGAWRAYVRLRSFGQQGRPNLRLLGAEFRDLDQTLLDQCRRLGSSATARGQRDTVRGATSSFGPKGRQVRRSKLQLLRVSLHSACLALDEDERSVAIGKKALEAGGRDVARCLSLARTALKACSILDLKEQAKRDEAIAKWQQSTGAEQVRRVTQAHPWLQGRTLTPVPFPEGALLLSPDLGQADIPTSAAWAQKSGATNLNSSVREAWRQMHTSLLEAQCPPCEESMPQPSPCFEAGVCLCSPEGKELRRVGAAFLAAMKKEFPAVGPARKLLSSASVIVRIEGTLVSSDDIEALLELGKPFREYYFHIGLMYFRPYRPTFMVVERQPDMPDANASAGNFFVKASRLKTKAGVSTIFAPTHPALTHAVSPPWRFGRKSWPGRMSPCASNPRLDFLN